MLDIILIRNNPDAVKKGILAKNLDPKLVDEAVSLDQKRRELIAQIEELRQGRNKLTKEQISKGKAIKIKLKELEPKLKEQEEKLNQVLNQIPNLPAPDVKKGKNETENEVVRTWGNLPRFSFSPLDHLTLGENLGLIDIKKAALVSGTRFGYLLKEGFLLEFALVQYVTNFLMKAGFIPVIPPALTKVSVFDKLGYSQHGENENYYLVYDPKKENPQDEANYYLIGTAEHALVPMHQGQTFTESELPLRYLGFSPAFRKEAGSWGKDTRGIFRVHQFEKLEMVSLIAPSEDADLNENQYLLSLAEKLVQDLKLPYRVVKMCTGDLGHPAARKYDLEVWFPAEKKYRETNSISTCTDYQSRALNIRFWGKNGEKDFVHILNGTAIAIGRIILAILENYQQKDGTVRIPKVLQKYVGRKIIKRS